MASDETTDPRDAEIARLHQQLAAAQADNAALRGALDMAHEVVASVADSWPIAFERVTEALATPAPGAPWIAAVRGLVEAADEMGLDSGCYPHAEDCEDDPDGDGADDGCDCGLKHMIEAIAAVRAVLPR